VLNESDEALQPVLNDLFEHLGDWKAEETNWKSEGGIRWAVTEAFAEIDALPADPERHDEELKRRPGLKRIIDRFTQIQARNEGITR
jgi:hypothetical protein